MIANCELLMEKEEKASIELQRLLQYTNTDFEYDPTENLKKKSGAPKAKGFDMKCITKIKELKNILRAFRS